ncbi:MAG TPA: flagellar basal body P-ring protein FlgI [Tepidisphaeraceae bacterium]|nr:flagellar basal body P-ring protein FlgI [Tepidisphaeraceae bacterium]
MKRTQGPIWSLKRALTGLMVCALVWTGGCGGGSSKATKTPVMAARYPTLPPRKVPAFLKDTILERCELQNAQALPVSSFALVSNLHGTGDSFAGTNVRQFILKEMVKHGFGSAQHGFEDMQPEDILKDNRFAIVRVDGFIPPGAKKHQRFDLYVSAIEGNPTSSLAHGVLYSSDLKLNGANTQAPGYTVDVWATGSGPLFVNPGYDMISGQPTPEARASLRRAVVMNGGSTLIERALVLRLRQPQLALARSIENRIDQAYQDIHTAGARDEAIITMGVPDKYGEDWDHFAQVVQHLYIYSSPDFTVMKTKELIEEANKPDAPLLDISYCWEGLGQTILPFIVPLMTSEKPDIAFAAARAAAFLGDSSAQAVLMEMARDSEHPFQINAVQTLAKLPNSPIINQTLRSLLDSDKTLVRLEAYRTLALHDDPYIVSRAIADKFILDIVQSKGPPIIYASRSGLPRIAVIGNKPHLNLPMLFTAVDKRFSISSEPNRDVVTVFYRGLELPEPVWFLATPDAAELVARLGGDGAPGDKRLDFNYCDVVALLQQLTDGKHLSANAGQVSQPVSFVLQEPSYVEQQAQEAPPIDSEPQPESEKIDKVDDALKNYGLPK